MREFKLTRRTFLKASTVAGIAATAYSHPMESLLAQGPPPADAGGIRDGRWSQKFGQCVKL